MRLLFQLFKHTFLAILALLLLGLGAFLIFLERKTDAAEEAVQSWKESTCKVLSVKAGSENNFYIQCQYNVDGKTYLAKNQTPSWNPYFNAVGSRDGKVVVTLIDSKKRSHFYEYQQGDTVKVWYQTENPENSVLIPYAASLRPFFYIGIAYYLLMAGLIIYAKKKSSNLKPPAQK